MNNKKRKELKNAIAVLEEAKDIIEGVLFDEECSLDNMPESLSDSELYSKIESAVDNMIDAVAAIDDALEYVSCASS